jgi:hypothetical protein
VFLLFAKKWVSPRLLGDPYGCPRHDQRRTLLRGVAHGDSPRLVVAYKVGWPMCSGSGGAQGHCVGGNV